MSMTDPIADLLTRIRNAQLARKSEVSVGSSRLKQAVVKVLKDEGYVADFRIAAEGGKSTMTIALKYYEGRPVIDRGMVPDMRSAREWSEFVAVEVQKWAEAARKANVKAD